MTLFSRLQPLLRSLALILLLHSPLLAADSTPPAQLREVIQSLFPQATRIDAKQGDVPAYPVYQLNELLGYAFESTDHSSLQGFAGKPIRLLIGLNVDGVLAGVRVLGHHEPVFLHGMGEKALLDFVEQYRQHPLSKPVVVGGRKPDSSDGQSITQFDGISKATVSVVILNESVLQSALAVARAYLEGFTSAPLATPRMDLFEPLDWQQLLERGLVQHWLLQPDELEQHLGHSLAHYPGMDRDQAFSELFFAYLDTPMSGRNLLGEQGFARLQNSLRDGEQALLVMSRGSYRHVPEDFTPASSPSRLLLVQNGQAIELHDMDFDNGNLLGSLAITPTDDLQAHIFRIKTHAAYNPAQPAQLRLNVNLQRNHLVESQLVLEHPFEPDPALFEIHQPSVADKPAPVWLRLWQERWWQLALLGSALLLVSLVFTFQHRISRHGRAFHLLRGGFLLFTLLFIGLYAQGQLSVVNISTLLLALVEGFDIRVFLMDPVIFVLWSFTFISLFIWGRGLFCGWLCPFGALQELVAWLGQKLRLRQWKIAEPLHRRLQWIKYGVLLVLLVSALLSQTLAERLAEVEPFKTTITLFLVRSWPFVAYALLLLGLGLFIHKFYCRYVCPLGAGLAVLGRLRLFSWLKRIDACGQPCQHCRNHCGIGAIHRDGRIDYDECIQCLECIVILHDDQQCVAAVSARKKAEKSQRKAAAGALIYKG